MSSLPNVETLFNKFHEQLALQWLAGKEGKDRSLNRTEDNLDQSLVGFLNTIHPNRIQILGTQELEYIDRLDKDKRKDLISNIVNREPAAIIIARGQNSPDELTNAAEHSKTPLFSSNLTGNKIISIIHQFIHDTFSEKSVIHGVLLEVHGLGVLLTGESAIGKSELALELITRNHRLIADDAPEFSRVGPDTIRGTCPDALRDFMEVRGLGILNIRSMYGDSAIKFSKDLRLVIHLKHMKPEDIGQVDRLNGTYGTRTILDVDIPAVTLPVASGRNLAVLVEAAVKHHILLRKGYNSTDAFIARQQQLINQKNPSKE